MSLFFSSLQKIIFLTSVFIGTLNAQVFHFTQGWNLKGASIDIRDASRLNSTQCVNDIYLYKNQTWQKYSEGDFSSLSDGDGFWLHAQQDCEVEVKEQMTASELKSTIAEIDGTITFANTLTSTNPSVQIRSMQASITTAGTYKLTGQANNAQVFINAKDEDTVILVLENLSLTSDTNASIYVQNAKQVILNIAQNSYNTLQDTSALEYDKDAVIYSRDDLLISGTGVLNITAGAQKGIKANDSLAIASATLNITSQAHGIKVNNKIDIEATKLTIVAGGDGIQSSSDNNKSVIYIKSGEFDITAYGDAISSSHDLVIADGAFNLISGNANTDIDTTSAKGLKASDQIVLLNGTYNINSKDDSLHSNGLLTVSGGIYNIASDDDGMHADGTLLIHDGTIDIAKSYEGLEAYHVQILGGDITLVASDDGINGAGGNDGSSTWEWQTPPNDENRTFDGNFTRPNDFGNPPPFGTADNNQTPPDGAQMALGGGGDGSTIEIAGGRIWVNASGDGIDVNGDLVLHGGLVVVTGPDASMNGALDYDVSFTVNGGTLIATGAAGMAQNASSSLTQNSVLIGLGTATTESLHLQDANGVPLFAYNPGKSYQAIFITSPLLQTATQYDLQLGGVVSNYSDSFHEYYTNPVVSQGTLATSFTLTENISTAGATLGNGGGGRPGR